MAPKRRKPKPPSIFLYGPLCALPLLAWILTGDASRTRKVNARLHKAKVKGYRCGMLRGRDYPAAIEDDDAWMDGYFLFIDTMAERRRIHEFAGPSFRVTSVTAHFGISFRLSAEMSVWAGDENMVLPEPWDLDRFMRERADDWAETFDGMVLVYREPRPEFADDSDSGCGKDNLSDSEGPGWITTEVREEREPIPQDNWVRTFAQLGWEAFRKYNFSHTFGRDD
ncbi:hypothetical protein QBC47DRAFT_464252 [Echria macrotheca]|uniref:Uncharacterized protein n=1 Tax=Echria macrotheca TaxID=438768 RepID=A0AAJ0B569_9PEZI|nr:hypothetical protein QBC47DRAFT_464252 [Echria macrotheca]